MTLFQSILLMVSGLILLFYPESTVLFQTIVFGWAILTVHIFYRLIKNSHLVRFGNLASFSILFGYVLSTAVYTVLNIIQYGDVSYTQNTFLLGYSQDDLSYAMLMILITSVLLSAISHFEKPLYLGSHLNKALSTRSLNLTIISAALIMIGIINADIGYMGVYEISERRISPFGALCFIAIPPLTAIAIGSLLSLPSNLKRYRKFLILVSIFLVLALIPLGRRVMMYSIILSVILISPTLFQSFQEKRIRIFYVLGGIAVLIMLVGWGFQTFYAMRMTIYRLTYEKKPPVAEIVPYTLDLMKDSYAVTELHKKLVENISHRPFIISYLAGLLDAHKKQNAPFFGELKYALSMAVPSLLQPEKTRKMASSSESFMHPLLGLPVYDGPNTMLTAGLNDLGFPGLLMYPVAVVILYISFSQLIAKYCPPFLCLFVFLRFCYSLLNLEESFGALIGSGLRDLFIVAFVYWIALKLPSARYWINKSRRST